MYTLIKDLSQASLMLVVIDMAYAYEWGDKKVTFRRPLLGRFSLLGSDEQWDKLVFPADFNESMVMFFDTEIWYWRNGKPGTPSFEELNADDESNAMQVEWVPSEDNIPLRWSIQPSIMKMCRSTPNPVPQAHSIIGLS